MLITLLTIRDCNNYQIIFTCEQAEWCLHGTCKYLNIGFFDNLTTKLQREAFGKE